MKGINIFGIEIKSCLLADDTILFNADLGSLKKTLKIMDDFGKLAGLFSNVKKTKATWLEKLKIILAALPCNVSSACMWSELLQPPQTIMPYVTDGSMTLK